MSEPNQKPETLIYSDAGEGTMRMVSVEDRSEIVTHFDGKPALDTGSGATDQHALAVTSTSPTSYTWTLFKEGKPWVSGRNVLAADRKSFSEVSWLIAKPEQKLTFTYERRHGPPERITTDGLRSYGAAMKELGNVQRQETGRHTNNRVENSHLLFRRRERAMLRFRQMRTLQKFSGVHANVYNHCSLEHHLVDRNTYKQRRSASLAEWRFLAS